MIDDIKVVVSIATLPDRIADLEPVIQSLKFQTLKPDRIHLWFSPFYKRLNKHFSLEQVPPELLSDKLLQTELVEDWGPVTKLYPAVQRYAGTPTIVVIMDDDRSFPVNFLEILVKNTIELNAVCTYRGRILPRPSYSYADSTLHTGFPELKRAIRVTHPTPIDIVTGTGGIAFPPHVLNADFIEFWQSYLDRYEHLQMHTDDIWISGYLAKNKHKRFIVPCGGGMKAISRDQEDSLWRINKTNDYNDQSIQIFRDYWD